MRSACLLAPVRLYGELCTVLMNVHLVLHLHNISGSMSPEHADKHGDGQQGFGPMTCRKLWRWRISVSLPVAGMTTKT
jgi:hypothetical protein